MLERKQDFHWRGAALINCVNVEKKQTEYTFSRHGHLMFLTLAFSKVGSFLFSPAEGAILCQKQPFKVHVDREQTKRGVLAKSETPFKCKIEVRFCFFCF